VPFLFFSFFLPRFRSSGDDGASPSKEISEIGFNGGQMINGRAVVHPLSRSFLHESLIHRFL
jgi:hypothetical protein